MVYDIVAGTTADISFQLLENGAAIPLTGVTVTLLLNDRTGANIASPGTITVTDATNAKVALTPLNSTIFVASLGPYSARWQLTDGSGRVSFVPTSNRDIWNIVGQ